MAEIGGVGCDEVLSEIEHYLHGELAPERSEQFVRHLAGCGPCFDRAEFQRRLKQIVQAKCRSQVTPEHLVVRIQAAIRAEPGPGEGEA